MLREEEGPGVFRLSRGAIRCNILVGARCRRCGAVRGGVGESSRLSLRPAPTLRPDPLWSGHRSGERKGPGVGGRKGTPNLRYPARESRGRRGLSGGSAPALTLRLVYPDPLWFPPLPPPNVSAPDSRKFREEEGRGGVLQCSIRGLENE